MHRQLPQKEFDVWGLSGIQSKISAHLEEIWTPDAFLLVFYLFSLIAFPLRDFVNLYHFSALFYIRVAISFIKSLRWEKLMLVLTAYQRVICLT